MQTISNQDQYLRDRIAASMLMAQKSQTRCSELAHLDLARRYALLLMPPGRTAPR